MRIFVSYDQAKGFFLIPLVQPFFGRILDQIRYISFFSCPASVRQDKVGIEIMSLPHKDFRKIKTLWVIAQMIFPDPGGLVSCVLQSIDKLELTGVVVGSCIVFEAVDVAVFSGQDGRPARSANRIGDVGPVQSHAFIRDPVGLGRFYMIIYVGADGLISMII